MSFIRTSLAFSCLAKAPGRFCVSAHSAKTTFNHVFLSSQADNKPLASFDEVRKVSDNKTVLLIDVREPAELQDTGVLPGSINIPLGEVETTLRNMPDSEFLKRFGRSKPDHNTPIIFSCLKGIRSGKAQDTAIKLGYKKTKNYVGGWADWAEKIK